MSISELNEQFTTVFNDRLIERAQKLEFYTEIAKSYLMLGKDDDPNLEEIMKICVKTYDELQLLKCVNALPISLS